MLTSDLHQVVHTLKNGGIALFPTDTVWGMGCSLQRLDAIKRFYTLKGREPSKPTAVLVGSVQMAETIALFTPKAKQLAQLHWPGALTIVTPVKPGVPSEILGETGKIGVRVPNFPLVQELADLLETGIVTGSANFAGAPSPDRKELIDQRLLELADMVLDGECGGQLPSTVVDASSESLQILRQGELRIS